MVFFFYYIIVFIYWIILLICLSDGKHQLLILNRILAKISSDAFEIELSLPGSMANCSFRCTPTIMCTTHWHRHILLPCKVAVIHGRNTAFTPGLWIFQQLVQFPRLVREEQRAEVCAITAPRSHIRGVIRPGYQCALHSTNINLGAQIHYYVL